MLTIKQNYRKTQEGGTPRTGKEAFQRMQRKRSNQVIALNNKRT